MLGLVFSANLVNGHCQNFLLRFFIHSNVQIDFSSSHHNHRDFFFFFPFFLVLIVACINLSEGIFCDAQCSACRLPQDRLLALEWLL